MAAITNKRDRWTACCEGRTPPPCTNCRRRCYELYRSSDVAEQGTDCRSENNEPGNRQHGHECNDKTVFNESLRLFLKSHVGTNSVRSAWRATRRAGSASGLPQGSQLGNVGTYA